MEIAIIGVGYVGLVTGTCFAEMGHTVICVDKDQEKIATLNRGDLPFFEPGLQELILRNQKANRLSFTTVYKEAIMQSTFCFIAVGTPPTPEGSADTSFVKNAAEEIGTYLNGYKVIINKSTVPVGTATLVQKQIQSILDKRGVEYSFDVVSNPEFLKEGSAIADCMKPDRIIIGTESEEAIHLLKTLYSAFCHNHDRIILMNQRSAELTKYASNAMLASRISFMNEIAGLCEKVGADINQIRMGISSDSRIGYHFLYAGAGFGGSCFPKDLQALMAMGAENNYSTPLLEAIETTNEKQKKVIFQKITDYFADFGGIAGKTIGIWGLSFKPNTDDIRNAPALILINLLQKAGANLRLFDPIAMGNLKATLQNQSNIQFCIDEYSAAKEADAIVLMTEWKQFRFVNLNTILSIMRGNAFFDGRNQYKAHEMGSIGFRYFGIGIPESPINLLQKLQKMAPNYANTGSSSTQKEND